MIECSENRSSNGTDIKIAETKQPDNWKSTFEALAQTNSGLGSH